MDDEEVERKERELEQVFREDMEYGLKLLHIEHKRRILQYLGIGRCLAGTAHSRGRGGGSPSADRAA